MRPALRAVGRLMRLLGYLAVGLWRARSLERLDEATRREIVRAWLAGVGDILGVSVQVRGAARIDDLVEAGSVWLPNHVSWLDIPLLGGIRPGTVFLAKSEIRHWPVIGRLARLAGTQFIVRGQGSEAAASAVAEGLTRGRQMVVFAEGTTSEGLSVRRFHARLLGPAIEAGRPLVPVALTYRDERGKRTTGPAFIGQESLWPSLWRVLRARGLHARIELLDPIVPAPDDTRTELARRAEQAVMAAVASS
ncbi:MAG: 1-acyl-sn-glycerol-3-phosphate acyltransferase [Halothiobacillaceae bacterium]|nr:1-acyl-sn-glycerol-3-phosphate acyltransferase [Halothiobacillaceae bacterium]